MGSRSEFPLRDGRRAVVVVTDRHTGDLAIDSPADELTQRRRGVVDAPWTWLRQVHGSTVVEVISPGEHAGVEADAAVTATSAAPLAVQAADCAPIALVDRRGAIGVVHAGWRGLLDGVIDAAVTTLTATSGSSRSEVVAVLGPCVHPECYEFSEADLAALVDRFGPTVRGTTSTGTTAFDLPAAVRVALAGAGVELDDSRAACTACGAGEWYSHRARQERGRHAVVAWIDES